MPRVYSDIAQPSSAMYSPRQRCWYCKRPLPPERRGQPQAYTYLEWVVCPHCVKTRALPTCQVEVVTP